MLAAFAVPLPAAWPKGEAATPPTAICSEEGVAAWLNGDVLLGCPLPKGDALVLPPGAACPKGEALATALPAGVLKGEALAPPPTA